MFFNGCLTVLKFPPQRRSLPSLFAGFGVPVAVLVLDAIPHRGLRASCLVGHINWCACAGLKGMWDRQSPPNRGWWNGCGLPSALPVEWANRIQELLQQTPEERYACMVRM